MVNAGILQKFPEIPEVLEDKTKGYRIYIIFTYVYTYIIFNR